VNRYLPYFRLQIICHLLPASYFCRLCLPKVCVESSSLLSLPSQVECLVSHLPFQALFTVSLHGEHPALFAACPFQFFAYYSVFFCGVGGQSQQDFDLQSSRCLLPPSSCHLGSSCRFLKNNKPCIYHLIQPFLSWIFIQKKSKHIFTQMFITVLCIMAPK
jgi:hypothetical protein